MIKEESITCPHCGQEFPIDYKYLARHFASRGGKARANKMTAEQRSELARKAINKRWGKLS